MNTFASPPKMNPISNQTLRMNIHFEVCRGGVVCENLPNSDVFLEISYTWSTERPTDQQLQNFQGGPKNINVNRQIFQLKPQLCSESSNKT